MHTVHHTHAVVLKSSPFGEANKRVWLLTEEFGLVVAVVQGVRKPGAKLQNHVADYAFIKADLVRGREVWRLISATLIEQPLDGKTNLPLARTYVRTLGLLERFLVGEGEHLALCTHVRDLAAVIDRTDIPEKYVDTLSLWRVVTLLGYVAPEDGDTIFLDQSFEDAARLMDDDRAKRFISIVNTSIKESQL